MAEQRFSAQAGPLNHLYELEDPVQRSPDTGPAVPGNGTTYGYGTSGYAPDQQQRQQHSPGDIAPIPESPIGTSHSRRPFQESLPSGRHFSLTTSSNVSPIHSRLGSYQTRPDSDFAQPNAPAAPPYNVPMTGYAPGVQYNPNRSYGVGAAPYPQAQSPPPVKPEHSYHAGATPQAPDADHKKKKICGMTMTMFLVLCVVLFLVVSGAILGGVFGSRVLYGPTPPTPTNFVSSITSTATNTITTSTSTSTSTSTINYAYSIPTGTWTITGGLGFATGTCINNPKTTNYKEVWYCPDKKNHTIVIHDYSTKHEFSYYLDMDIPTRVRGVSGTPPAGGINDKDKLKFWSFSLQYKQQASFTTVDNCEVDVGLMFLLGRTQAIAGFVE
ncbi:hypothetical protein L211DRAFT_832356 [Terfezia boudieri ATCC MYA-4762]|uniref:Uncharacterized protein n=1 Tax=Terfezia boudieri ATCC MYA-4762 TaxID=1051890 RepID=A0A3N4M3Q9_9PEZI|nr:hypothetical protein L211DRAFT_832356 [Terfezia boudieri ATCC MYA-4762]